MNLTTAHTVWTILSVLVFIGIVVWAWSGAQKGRFDRAARSVLDDESVSGDKNHG